MAKLFNLRDGFTAADDRLPARFLEPLKTGPFADKPLTEGPFSKVGDGLLHLTRLGRADRRPESRNAGEARHRRVRHGVDVDADVGVGAGGISSPSTRSPRPRSVVACEPSRSQTPTSILARSWRYDGRVACPVTAWRRREDIMAELPGGTVTFLLSDVEGSTALWEQASEAMRPALARHDVLFEQAVREHGGVHIRPRGEGDSRFAVFTSAPDAVAATLTIQRAFAAEDWPTPQPIRVRIGLHTARPSYAMATTTARRSTGALACGRSGTAARSCSRRRPRSWSATTCRAARRLLDLGEHRLKDLIRPERVFQLVDPELPADFPTARLARRSAAQPAAPDDAAARARPGGPGGRAACCSATTSRLVTLTGPGGTGKTRLGLQVAADLLDQFADGVFFVELAPISDPALVVSTIAQALGVQGDGRPPAARRPRSIRCAGGSSCWCSTTSSRCSPPRRSSTTLLRAVPGLSVLVTSRAPLQLRGRARVPGPAAGAARTGDARSPREALSQYGAVALFVERATRHQAGLRGDQRERAGRGRDLRPPGRAAAGDRAGGGADPAALAGGDAGAPGATAWRC